MALAASTHANLGQMPDAELAYERLGQRMRELGLDRDSAASVHFANWGNALYLVGNIAEADLKHRIARDLSAAAGGRPTTRDQLLARNLAARGYLPEAKLAFDSVLAETTAPLPPTAKASALLALARLQIRLGAFDDARNTTELLAAAVNVFSANSPNRQFVGLLRAQRLRAMGEPTAALAFLSATLAALEPLSARDEITSTTHVEMAYVFAQLGRAKDARAAVESAMAIQKRRLGRSGLSLWQGEVLSAAADVESNLGNIKAASEIRLIALENIEFGAGADAPIAAALRKKIESPE
jgi:hypothetical protein